MYCLQVLFAYCDVAPPEGGETPLVLSNVVYRMMAEREPEFVARLAKEGLCYTRVAPEESDVDSALGRSWKSTFFAEDKETGQINATKAGFTIEWMPDGSMKYTTAPLEAIRVDPRTGELTCRYTLCRWSCMLQ
jgi:Taurine catabolism dioxygenase TauD, TfdA family